MRTSTLASRAFHGLGVSSAKANASLETVRVVPCR